MAPHQFSVLPLFLDHLDHPGCEGTSLEALAGEAGITRNMLSLIERGEGNPSWVTVRGIAKALGLSIADLAKAAEKLEA